MTTKVKETIARVENDAERCSMPDVYRAGAYKQLYEMAMQDIEQLKKQLEYNLKN